MHYLWERSGNRQTHGVHTDSALSFAVRIEQRSLEANRFRVREALLVGDLHAISSIRIHVWQREQVRGAHEEVSMECMHLQTTSAADSHYRLKSNFPGKIALETRTERFYHVWLCLLVEREVVYTAAAMFANASYREIETPIS